MQTKGQSPEYASDSGQGQMQKVQGHSTQAGETQIK